MSFAVGFGAGLVLVLVGFFIGVGVMSGNCAESQQQRTEREMHALCSQPAADTLKVCEGY